MKNTILKFGLISGAFCALLVATIIPLEDKLGHSYVVGYTVIVLSFLLVYFGIRSYRDNLSGGHITFARAFAIGISICLITCCFYVLAWEILYFNFMHDYMDKYAASVVDNLRASGASAAAIQARIQAMAEFKQKYENPLYNSAITFLEPFPVGLLIALISAAVLRKKPKAEPAPSTLAASA